MALDLEDVTEDELREDELGIELPDPPDVDPLYSTVTNKTYRSKRGKTNAETRWFNTRGGKPKAVKDPTTVKATAKKMTTAQLKKGVKGIYENVGMGIAFIHQEDGQLFFDNAETCAEAMVEWAESDPRVREKLEKMLSGSVMTKLIIAHAPIALGLAMNHGFNPAAMLGLGGGGGSQV